MKYISIVLLALIACSPRVSPVVSPVVPPNSPQAKAGKLVKPDSVVSSKFQPTWPKLVTRDGDEKYLSTVDLSYTDPQGAIWLAPAGTITDGASIPQAAWSIIGAPNGLVYRAAALVHDAYCGIDNAQGPSYHTKPWRDVHRMFLYACLDGQTPALKAKTMYAAVYFFGPRWNEASPSQQGGNQGVTKLPGTEEQRVMAVKVCKQWIEWHNPTVQALDDWMEGLNNDLIAGKEIGEARSKW